MPDFETYQSPFTWRYGSTEMRRIWSEVEKRRLWRKIWVALADVQAEYGLVQPDQVQDLQKHVNEVDIERAFEIESQIHHDLMAELKTFAEQCPTGGGILHQGATSMDIEDNADALRIAQSLDLLKLGLRRLLLAFQKQIEQWAELPVIAFTHLQPAEPSTLGYRLAQYAQDLLADWELLSSVQAQLRGKGFKGAVGTGAAYAELIGVENLPEFESRLSSKLGLPFYLVATQVYPRKQDYNVVSALAGLGATLYKFAFDLRLLQSPTVGEWSEPFGKRQVGSSAMPFKRNPIQAEKLDSLARMLAGMPRLAWDNAAHSLLERTLDDSANRRTMLPEAFLLTDELLITAHKLVDGLQVNETAVSGNLEAYGPFAATERVLMALSKAGADRQEMHERLREHAMSAWEAVKKGDANPLIDLIVHEPAFREHLTAERLTELMDASLHIGNANQLAMKVAQAIDRAVRMNTQQ